MVLIVQYGGSHGTCKAEGVRERGGGVRDGARGVRKGEGGVWLR